MPFPVLIDCVSVGLKQAPCEPARDSDRFFYRLLRIPSLQFSFSFMIHAWQGCQESAVDIIRRLLLPEKAINDWVDLQSGHWQEFIL